LLVKRLDLSKYYSCKLSFFYISDVTLYYQNAAARVIHMDNGATNGIVHIIDSFLFVQSDLTLSNSCRIQLNTLLLLPTLLLAYILSCVY